MSDPSGLGRVLNDVVSKLGGENPMEAARIFSSWEAIVGPEIAARCRPTSLKGGVLRVKADSPIWASEFKYLASRVTAMLNEAVGKPVVKQIKPWVASSNEHPTKSKGGFPSRRDTRDDSPEWDLPEGPNADGSPSSMGPSDGGPTGNKAGSRQASDAPDAIDLESAQKVASQIPDERLAESLKRALLAAKMRKKRG